MSVLVFLGSQWGDEGKGKATDLLGDRVDNVFRYQCGNCTGHTVVIDPTVLLEEFAGLLAQGVDSLKLLISSNAHLITGYHLIFGKVTELFLGKAQIGTTGRGMGPTCGDKIAGVGDRVHDLFDESLYAPES